MPNVHLLKHAEARYANLSRNAYGVTQLQMLGMVLGVVVLLLMLMMLLMLM